MASTSTQFDTDCALMLHCDGADQSTVITDSSFNSVKTVTARGNAQIDTAQSKFGGASLLLDGTGDWVDTPDSADWFLGTGDFTIDCWIRTSAAGYGTVWYQGGSDASGATYFGIVNYPTANKFQFCYDYPLFPANHYITSTTSVNNGAWHHIAVVRNSTRFDLYVDGTSEANTTDAYNMTDVAYLLYIGSLGIYNNFNGWIDEFRWVKGTAVWTANFTPPSAAYTSLQPTNFTNIDGVINANIKTINDLAVGSVKTRDGLSRT